MPRGAAATQGLKRRGGPARETAHLAAAHGLSRMGGWPSARHGAAGLRLELRQPQPLGGRARAGAR
eukprot:6352055-Lingulodinium_polyedra.AAC.1